MSASFRRFEPKQSTSERWGLSIRTIDRMVVEGVLTAYKVRRSVRFDIDEVDAALTAHTVKP